MATTVPSIPVIIPAYNASATIRTTLESVLEQDYPNLEIIVISDGSRDATVEIVRQLGATRVRVVERETNQGLAATLQEGVRQTEGPFVMFLHADCQLMSPSWIRRAVSHFQDTKVGWVTGFYEMLRPEKTNLVDQAFAVLRGEMLLRHSRGDGGVQHVPFSEGKCDVLRREVLTSIGGIPLTLRRSGEDQLLSYAIRRKGWAMLKDNSLEVQQLYKEEKPFSLILSNLKKEFVHGKTQAVINLKYWPMILRDLTNLRFAARKGSHPVFKAGAFAVTFATLVSAAALRSPVGFAPLLVLFAFLTAYYLWKCYYAGVRLLSPLAPLVVALGFASYIPYGIGLVWGALRFLLMAARLYTRPI